MAIKWKNNLSLIITGILLFAGWQLMIRNVVTIGQQSIIQNGNSADHPELFLYQEYNFTEKVSSLYAEDYLKNFNKETIAQKNINESAINEYRYQYGDYESQVRDIDNQYKESIQSAQGQKDQKLIKSLMNERDEKILAITNNFMDDTVVKEKLVSELTAKIMKEKSELLENMEEQNQEFSKNYWYFLKDEKGKVYKNLQNLSSNMTKGELVETLEKKGTGKALSINTTVMSPGVLNEVEVLNQSPGTMTGYLIMISGSDAAVNYQRLQKIQRNKTGLFSLGVVAFLLGLILFFKELWEARKGEKNSYKLTNLPIDVQMIALGLAALVILVMSVLIRRRVSGVAPLLFSLIGLCLIYGGLWLSRDLWLKINRKTGSSTIRQEMMNSLSNRLWQKVKKIYYQLPVSLQMMIIVASISLFLIISWQIYFIFFYNYPGYSGSFFALMVLIVLFLVLGLTIKREKHIQKILKKPGEILAENQEPFEKGNQLKIITDNLASISEIVAQAKAQKNQSDELKTELLTNVSHDLRTPLTSIITYGDLLTKEKLTDAERQDYTEIINRKALRMKLLIDDLFEVTKMNNGEVTLNRKMINLGQLIQQGIAEYSEELANKELKLLYSKPEESVLMEIDGDRMWRVFDNLVGNVVKYSMPMTRVYLKLVETSETVSIHLKNISKYELNEEADKLVERFTRGDEARNTEGSGLGLAIANSIVTLHEGNLKIEVDGDMFKVTIELPKTIKK